MELTFDKVKHEYYRQFYQKEDAATMRVRLMIAMERYIELGTAALREGKERAGVELIIAAVRMYRQWVVCSELLGVSNA